MAVTYKNPYPYLATQFAAGMDAIADDLEPITPAPTVDDLVTAVYDYIVSVYYTVDPPEIGDEQTLKSGIYTLINGYNNAQAGGYLQYDSAQMGFIYQLLEATAVGSPDQIKKKILNIEENIVQSGLTPQQQTPLLMATAVGVKAFDYWEAIITTPGDWGDFITSLAGPELNFPYWVSAAMEGTLMGFNLVKTFPGSELADTFGYLIGNSIGPQAALVGALTVGAGRVVFKWEPDDVAGRCGGGNIKMGGGCGCK